MKIKTQKLLPWLLMLLGLGTTAWADGLDEPIPSFYQEPGMSRTRDYVNQHALGVRAAQSERSIWSATK